MSLALPVSLHAGALRMPLSEALSLGSAAWEAIQSSAASPSPFMSWAWHRAWADAAPEAAASETLVLRDDQAEILALLPLARRRIPFRRVPVEALTWAIGDLGCPDHLDVLARPDADVGAFAPLLEELDWKILVLSNLAADAPAARRLCEALAARGHVVRREPLWTCPYLDLSSDWEGYLRGLSAKHRQALRSKDRDLRRRYDVAITDYDEDRVDEGWCRLVTLHERRWPEGAFRDPSVNRLHRRFTAELARRGQLWLTTLDLDGEPAAAWYGFTCRDTVYFYQSGRDPRFERESVGEALMAAMIRRAMERGFQRFDFLRGDDPYKQRWTKTRAMTEEITVFRRGWSGRWLRGLNILADLRGRLTRSADG